MPEDSIEPASDLPEFDELPHDADAEREALERAIVLRLNGGLGTSMGLTGAKSLLEAKDGLSFLDVIARQVLALRDEHDVRLPLVLMDSFSTRDDSLEALGRHSDLDVGLPLDFLQNKEPKLLVDDLSPAEWPDDPGLEWCPPGHGDLYTALVTSGMLESLLEHGFEYAFVANSDNLGAVLEPRILAWLRVERIRSRWRSRTAPRPTARAATWQSAARTAGWCCARPPRRPRKTSRRCRTSTATATSTRTTCGSNCARSTRRWATACSSCR